MHQEVNVRAGLLELFTNRPNLLQTLSVEPSRPDMWEEIFLFFFKEYPIDDENKDVPTYWRPGSTDPRWDTLLRKEELGAMRVLDALTMEWKDGTVRFPPYEEAA